ncbi:FimV/HubP family polar landmark protein [Psychromonas aquatilis]|uniref:FimV/HubP family polar landmark protein n=1 Tax=Psychromonas aquatilis TaxID=2005072 RepID=A0ABU9GMP3_9GAMM
MNRILLSFVCCTALISTVNVYSDTSSADNQFQHYVTKQTYGPITTYETLWSVSNKLRPNKDVSVYQTLLAIYKTNPSAFLNGDINKIIINSVIDIPSTAFIAEQRNAEALKLLNIGPNKVSHLSNVKAQADLNIKDQDNSEQLALEPTTQNTDELPVDNVTTVAPTDAKYYLPDIATIQQARSQDEAEDTDQGMIYLSDLPSINEKSDTQEQTSALDKENDVEELNTTSVPESSIIDEASTTELLNEEDQTGANSEEVLVVAEDKVSVNDQANLVEGNTKVTDVENEQTDLTEDEASSTADLQVNLTVGEDTTNLDAHVDLSETQQTTELDKKEALVTDVEQEVETDPSLAEENVFNNVGQSVQSEEVNDAKQVNENTASQENDDIVDLNTGDETGNNQSIAEESVKTSETEQTTDSVAQALIEEMEVEQKESNSLPAPFSEAELQNQAQTEKTQSDIDKELALLYEQLNTVTEANKVLKQRLQPLSEQITLLSNQLNKGASVEDELQSLVEEYKAKIESFEQSPYSGEGFHNAIFRYITDSPIALISAILVPLILLTAIFLFLLRRKNNQDSLQAEDPNKSEIAGSELDGLDELDDFDILLSELTVLKNDDEIEVIKDKLEAIDNDLEDFVAKTIVLSDIEEYLDSEDRLSASKESVDEHLVEATDSSEHVHGLPEALDTENEQQTDKVDSLTIGDEQEQTNKKVVEENTHRAEAENSQVEEAGGGQVVTDGPHDKALEAGGSKVITDDPQDKASEVDGNTVVIDDPQDKASEADRSTVITDDSLHEAKEAAESKVVIDDPQDKGQQDHASTDDDKTDQDYIAIDYLLSNNDGNEVSEEEFDLDFGLDEFPDVINATDFDTDADRISAQLDLARAYLEIDEKKNAKAILVKLLDADEDKLQEVHRLLERIG